MIALSLLLFCAFLLPAEFRQLENPRAADATLVAGGKGTAVVLEAVRRVQASGIFPDDHQLLRRIAWVESLDGTHPNTYRLGYNGGIFQVDSIGFKDTQTHPTAIKKLHAKIKQHFGVDWPKMNWSESRKPLYSALAARAKLYITGAPAMCLQAIPVSLQDQAQHWKICYNTIKGAGTVQHFLSAVAVMPNA